MTTQLQLPLYPGLKDKEVLQPLDVNSLSLYWNHNGFFNLDLYEKLLKEREKDKAPCPMDGDNMRVSFSYGFNYLLKAAINGFKDSFIAFNRKSYYRITDV